MFPSIPEFYKNKHVFITGASGFLGKVLVEKLLRSCPEIGNIYILIRPKKNRDIEERVKEITDLFLFNRLRDEIPGAFDKIVPINGDASKSGLGMSKNDRQTLIDNVSLIFHVAASVRFDDSLKYAILMNVKSAVEMSKLALEMKKLLVFQHVSTTYCNIDKKVIEEKLYPAHSDWREALMLAEQANEKDLETLTPKYIFPFINTYVYTKFLAEHAINDLLVGKIPAIILRPSVVISTMKEPFQGWLDSFSGPFGLLIAGGKGIMKTIYGDHHVETDYVAVDNTVKLMIAASWEKSVLQKNKLDLNIYNASKPHEIPRFETGQLIEMGQKMCWNVPFQGRLWYPRSETTKCWYEYYINVLIFHLLPALIVDSIMKITGRRPFLFKIQRKIYIANMAISHFMLNEWQFINNNSIELTDNLLDEDKEAFLPYVVTEDEERYEYMKSSCLVARKSLLKEEAEIAPETYAATTGLYILDRIVHGMFIVIGIWFIFFKVNLLPLIWKYITTYWNTL